MKHGDVQFLQRKMKGFPHRKIRTVFVWLLVVLRAFLAHRDCVRSHLLIILNASLHMEMCLTDNYQQKKKGKKANSWFNITNICCLAAMLFSEADTFLALCEMKHRCTIFVFVFSAI